MIPRWQSSTVMAGSSRIRAATFAIVNRDSEAQLLAFCVDQRSQFDAPAWENFSAVTRLELATTVRYLSGVAWYGHQPQLRELAAQLSPEPFSVLARQTAFDPSRFAGLLQAHLRHATPAVAT